MNDAVSSAQTSIPARGKVRHVELLISLVLRSGVIISLVLVIGGAVLSFVQHPEILRSPLDTTRLIGPGSDFPHTVPRIIDDACRLRGRALMVIGLLVLISTPVMRVAVSVLGFLYLGDRAFIFITSVVMAMLLLSFLVGKAER